MESFEIIYVVAKAMPLLEKQLMDNLPQAVLRYTPDALAKLYLSVQDVAAIAKVTDARIYDVLKKGQLKATRNENGIRIALGDLFEYLNEREIKRDGRTNSGSSQSAQQLG